MDATLADLGALGRQYWPMLFSSQELRGRTVRNRIVSTPHSTGWGHDGLITPAEVDYHVRKAEGGAGLVMTFGSASVDPSSAASYGSVSLWDERNDDALETLARRVHDQGALVMSQMTHLGRRGNSLMSGVPLKAVSDLAEGVHHEVPAVLSTAEISELVGRFAHAARRLMRLGWDGAEVTSLGGHLIEQFFDPSVNDRTDCYGAQTMENRVRFAREVLAAVRESTSDDFVISFRMTADQAVLDGALSTTDLQEIATAITAQGSVDLLSICNGTGYTDRSSSVFVPGDELPVNNNGVAADAMRRATGVPVLVAGRILDAAIAERALVEDGVDLVAMTRALIADPDLPRKAAIGQKARPCISLNEGCIGRLYQGLPMWCSVNPSIREPELGTSAPVLVAGPALVERAEPVEQARRRRVVVVGGGVAGAEAAYRAAAAGDNVVLLERSNQVGGRARIAGSRRGRERWGLYLSWLVDQLDTTGVDVRLDTHPSVDDVLDLEPDAVVLATGSVLRTPPWADGQAYLDADAVAAQAPAPPAAGAVALVVDDEGGFVAPTAAEALVGAGWKVRLATSLPAVAIRVDPTQVWFVRRRLKLAGVDLVSQVSLRHGPDGWLFVDVESDLQTPVGPVDLLVVAGARRSRAPLGTELHARRPELLVTRIGDALAPRSLLDAVAEGARAGLTLREHPVEMVPASASAG